MKFLIIAPRFHTNLYYRAKALQDAGHKVKVAVLYKGKSEFYENIEIVKMNISFLSSLILKIYSLLKKTKSKTSFEFRIQYPGKNLKKITKTYKPDVIILKAYQNALAIKTLLIAKKQNIKVLMLTQTPYNHIKGSAFLFKLNIKLFEYLKVFAYVTPVKTNFDVFKKSGIENIYYIPFVYPVSGSANKKPQNKNIKIISVGKFVKRKDHLLLLNVTERLIKDGFAVKLTLAGEIQNPEIHKTVKKYINEHNLAKTVNIKTDIPYPEMKNEYRKHDLFVLPSRKEPAAYSVTEAAANALPVICSDENGTSCYIENGINGCVFKAGNENDLYQKIKLCITDTEKLRKMSEAALNSAKKNHNPEIFAETITEIVKTQK